MITVIIIGIMIIRIMLVIIIDNKTNNWNKNQPNSSPPTSFKGITSSDSPHWWRIPTPRYVFSRHGPPRPVKWETKIDTFEVCGFSSFSILVKIGVALFCFNTKPFAKLFWMILGATDVVMNSFRFLHISVESCHWYGTHHPSLWVSASFSSTATEQVEYTM